MIPAWLDRALWYDLSPMRPDDLAATDATRWTEAIQLQRAWHEGIADANDEKSTNERLAKIDTANAAA